MKNARVVTIQEKPFDFMPVHELLRAIEWYADVWFRAEKPAVVTRDLAQQLGAPKCNGLMGQGEE